MKTALIAFIASAALVAGAMFFGESMLRGWIERTVSQRTGYELTLSDVRIRWGLRPVVVLEGVRLSSPPEARDAVGFDADRVCVTPSPFLLLTGRPRFSEVVLTHPNLVVERGAEGNAESSDDLRLPFRLHRVVIEDGTFVYRDARQKVDLYGTSRCKQKLQATSRSKPMAA